MISVLFNDDDDDNSLKIYFSNSFMMHNNQPN